MKIAQTLTSILLFTSTLMTTFSPAFADDSKVIDPKAGDPKVSDPKADTPKVTIQGASGEGSGCPDGSTSATVSPDGQEISILFSQFISDATKPTESRKSCNLAIPVKVPAGFQVSLYSADFRGYVGPDTTGKLSVEYFFAGQKGPKYMKDLKGEIEYTETQELLGTTFSKCGDSVNMRVNAAMTAKGKGIASVDTLDVAHKGTVASIPPHLIYRLKYQACPAKT